jgi:tripartite-type tricarboxylate transporter receptor subunit TctC
LISKFQICLARIAIKGFGIAAFALALAAGIGMVEGAEVADFYRGKTLRIFVGYGPGTGYDVYARLLGRHLSKHIPGQPGVVIQNMPGAASLTMLSYLYNVAPRDGTAIGLPARGLFIEPLLGNDNAKFEARKFTALGSMGRDTALCFSWHTSGITTIEDARSREVLVGSSATTSPSYQLPMIVNAVIGTKFKPLLGYVDSSGVGFAMEREEIAGYCSFTWASIKSARPKWIADKQINLLLQLTLSKHPELPHVPLAMDLAKDEDARQTFTLAFADQEMGRPVVAPPDVPTDRAGALRAAFDATMADNDFMADAARMAIEIDPIDAKAVEGIIDRLYATSKRVVERVKTIYHERTPAN